VPFDLEKLLATAWNWRGSGSRLTKITAVLQENRKGRRCVLSFFHR
jgi:hypothetical protein